MEKQGTYGRVSFAELSLHIWCHKHKMANDQKNSNSLFCKNLDMS